MRFELEPYNLNVSEDEILSDLRRVATGHELETLTMRQYRQAGRFGVETIRRRFGSWNNALQRANLTVRKRWRIKDESLLENLESIWRRLGRQPRRSDLDRVPTEVSKSVYEVWFGSWRKALEAFVAWINDEGRSAFDGTDSPPVGRLTPQEPSLRLRFRVMRRDRFCCRHCGRSPASTVGLELHVDHIRPWSDCGETVLENLQTLCAD